MNTTSFAAASNRSRGAWAGCRISFVAGVVLAVVQFSPSTLAQVPMSGRGRNFVAPVTDAQGKKSVLRGKDVRPAGKGLVEITGMQAETYRGQAKDMMVEAPQCVFDTKANVATSPGSLSIRTADERFSIQGQGFLWQLGDSRLNSKLMISNQVHALVRKRALNTTNQTGVASASVLRSAGVTTAPDAQTASAIISTNDLIEITADHFEYQSDRVTFSGRVRVHEAEGDLACELLSIYFKDEGSVLERIEAEQNVVLDQGGTRAIADKAVYSVDRAKEVVEFSGNARWQNGDREGSAQRLTFMRGERTLFAEEKAYLKVPRAVLVESGFQLENSEGAPSAETTSRPGYAEVFSDIMSIQLSPTNGPVQRVIAEKNVLIVDPGQEGRALAQRAVYEESTGTLELTGVPSMETKQRRVTGQVLRFDRASKSFSSGPDAYVKLPLQALENLALFSPLEGQKPTSVATTNAFIEVWATQFRYRTNQLEFLGAVRANFLEGNVSRGKLTCDTLTIIHRGRLESILAEGKVNLEQFASSQQPVGRKVKCESLRADFTAEGRIAVAVADNGVVAEQSETLPDRPLPLMTHLRSDKATALFAKTTNQLERLVAETGVVFAQDGRVARGTMAVYTESNGQVELTGQPTATMPEGEITGAERLIWDRAHGRFIGKGRFKSEWKSPPGGTNGLSTASINPTK